MTGRALMVWGASSDVGKSVVATGLCRHFARRGYRVAPYKAQNMSNNARVVDGGEIGVAQYLQALAAGVAPDVRMNPVLVKPESDTSSQVVVLGRPDLAVSALPWMQRHPHLHRAVDTSLDSLLADHDLVVMEGAGSPAEPNLWQSDLVNHRPVERTGAPALLVGDIDRGGVFAHLYGTWAILPPVPQAAVRGMVLNKFRGDASLLTGALDDLHQRTGVPVLGVVPWLDHALPDEEGITPGVRSARHDGGAVVTVVAYPTASNLDEFAHLGHVATVRWARHPHDLVGADIVVLPGSKHVAADLAWLRATGLADAVTRHAAAGGRVLGVCGGLQMLGRDLVDDAGVDGSATGLGLLPLATRFGADKLVERTVLRFGVVDGPWSALSGCDVPAYEIRHGRTGAADRSEPGASAEDAAVPVEHGGRAWQGGGVLGVSAHGLLEDPHVLALIFGDAAGVLGPAARLETAFDQVADLLDASLDLVAVESWLA